MQLQGKIKTIALFLMLVAKGRFETIHHFFPIRGHSYLHCDRDFCSLNRALNKLDRVYLMKEYAEVIVHSSAKANFLVNLVQSQDILNFKKWWPNFYRKSVLSKETSGRGVPKEQKQPFNFYEFMEFCYSSEYIGTVKGRKYVDGIDEHHFALADSTIIPRTPTELAYPEGYVPILDTQKKEDIKKFQNYLPDEEEVQKFYREILNWPIYSREDE